MKFLALLTARTSVVSALFGLGVLGVAASGCGDSTVDPAEQFVGAWSYDRSVGQLNCGGEPIDESPTGNKTFGLGVTAPLVDLTISPADDTTFCDTPFDVDGPVATARTTQSCTLLGGDTLTIDHWTFSLTSATTAEEQAAATFHSTQPATITGTMPTPISCAFTSTATLTRVSKD